MLVLDLRSVSQYATIRSAVFSAKTEAASVMLWKFYSPNTKADGTWRHCTQEQPVQLQWENPERDLLAAHSNELDATEDGAYAIAMAIANQLGFKIVARAHHGSGADWILARNGEPVNDYYKLEVSGMARMSAESPEHRLKEKLEQIQRGDYDRPGLAVVTRFEDACVLSGEWQ